jgi:hypothetical protein
MRMRMRPSRRGPEAARRSVSSALMRLTESADSSSACQAPLRSNRRPSFQGCVEFRCASDYCSVGEQQVVECLRCGGFRAVARERTQRLDPGDCLSCGYLGWAAVADLSDPVRRELRMRPPEDRPGWPHLHAV